MNRCDLVREGLGLAHYERMRQGMAPAMELPPWEELPDKAREAYRARFDYAIPHVAQLLGE